MPDEKGRLFAPFIPLFFYDSLKEIFHFLNIVGLGEFFTKTVTGKILDNGIGGVSTGYYCFYGRIKVFEQAQSSLFLPARWERRGPG